MILYFESPSKLNCSQCDPEVIVCLRDNHYLISGAPYIDGSIVGENVGYGQNGTDRIYGYSIQIDETLFAPGVTSITRCDVLGITCRGCLTSYIDWMTNIASDIYPNNIFANWYDSAGVVTPILKMSNLDDTVFNSKLGKDFVFNSNLTTPYGRFGGSTTSVVFGKNAGGGAVGTSVLIGEEAFNVSSVGSSVIVGYQAGRIHTTGSGETYVGYQAGLITTNSANNTLIGYKAGLDLTDSTCSQNTIVGASAGRSLTGSYNTLLGYSAGKPVGATVPVLSGCVAVGSNTLKNFTGNVSQIIAIGDGTLGKAAVATGGSAYSVAIGGAALANYTGADYNLAIGFQSGYGITTGKWNTFLGNQSGRTLVTGQENILIGSGAALLGSNAYNYTVGVGSGVLRYLTGEGQTAIGCQALYNSTGFYNTALGHKAGTNLSTGDSNVYIGYNAGPSVATVEFSKLYINNAAGIPLIGGDFALSTVHVNGNLSATGILLTAYNAIYGIGAGASVTTGAGLTLIGTDAGRAITVESFDTFVGLGAGRNVVGCDNSTYIGYLAGEDAFGDNQTAVGMMALVNAVGTSNVAVGYMAGNLTSTGLNNTYIGTEAGLDNGIGSGNTSLGYRALHTSSIADSNTAIGCEANYNTSGFRNVALGYRAGYFETGGSDNVFIGADAGPSSASVVHDQLYIANHAGVPLIGGDFGNKTLSFDAITTTTTGTFVVPNNVSYESLDFAGTGVVNLIKADVLDNTFISVLPSHELKINEFGTLNHYGRIQDGVGLGKGEVAIGYNALVVSQLGGLPCSENVAIGSNAGVAATNGAGANVFIGVRSGETMVNGVFNTIVGYRAGGNANADSSGLVCLGQGAGPNTAGVYNDRFYISNVATDTPVLGGSLAYATATVEAHADLKVTKLGCGLYIKEGADATMGSAAANGTVGVTITTTKITAASRVFITNNNPIGTPGVLYVDSRTPGVSFVIKSTEATDACDLAWVIVEPA